MFIQLHYFIPVANILKIAALKLRVAASHFVLERNKKLSLAVIIIMKMMIVLVLLFAMVSVTMEETLSQGMAISM